jgi:hypothetical protein
MPTKLFLSLVLISAVPAFVRCGGIAKMSHSADETTLRITGTPDDLNFDSVPVPSGGFGF